MSDPALPVPPPLLKELSAAAYMQWKHETTSRIFWAYLADRVEDYQDFLLAQALSAEPDVNAMKEARARVLCLTELQALDLNDIKSLYGIEAKPSDKAPE